MEPDYCFAFRAESKTKAADPILILVLMGGPPARFIRDQTQCRDIRLRGNQLWRKGRGPTESSRFYAWIEIDLPVSSTAFA